MGSTSTNQSSLGFRIKTTAPVGKENIIANNLFYDVVGNGNQHGIFCIEGAGLQVLNNTFVIDNLNSTPSSINATSGIIVYDGTQNLQVKNNIIYVRRGGLSSNYGIYIDSNTTSVTSDYNSIYVNGAGPTYYGYRNHNTFTTFSDWQGANSSSYDQSSINVVPGFASISTGDLTPTNMIINGAAQVVGNVTDDFYGNVRSTTKPDIGAIEFAASFVNDSCSGATLITTGTTTGNYLSKWCG